MFSDGHIIDLVVSQVRHYAFGCRGCKKRLWLPISFLSPLERNGRHRNKYIHTTLALLAAAALLTLLGLLLFAQGSPRVTGVDPSSGKVNDTVTVAGENLGKGAVSAVFLSVESLFLTASTRGLSLSLRSFLRLVTSIRSCLSSAKQQQFPFQRKYLRICGRALLG